MTFTDRGPPHGPKGEKCGDTPAAAGEGSPRALAKRANSAPSSSPDSNPGSSGSEIPGSPRAPDRIAITRATGKIFFDPRDAAERPDLHRQRVDDQRACGGAGTCSACRLYRGLDEAGREIVRAMNAGTRRLWQLDGAALDALRKEGAKPSAKSWPLPDVEGKEGAPESAMYRHLREISPSIASGIVATLSKKLVAKWREVRWDALVREIKSPPHYRRGFPIPIRTQSFRLVRLTGEVETYLFRFSLGRGRHEGGAEYKIPIRPRDKYQAQVLRMLADCRVGGAPNEAKVRIGEAKIAEDRRHPGKWMVTFSYTRLSEKAPESEISAGINRGIVCFLAAVTSTRRQWLYDGADIEAGLQRIQARRKRYQRDAKASGRDGHGRVRLLKPIEHLEAKGERWRASKCQTIARRIAKWLVAEGVQTVYLEDFSGIRDGEPERLEGGKFVWDRIQSWPYDQLGTRIQSCLEEEGVRVVERPAAYISRRCPKCGVTARENMDLKRRVFHCQSCGHKRHLDAAAAENLRLDGERERLRDEESSGGARST